MYSQKHNRSLWVILLFFVFIVSVCILLSATQTLAGGTNWQALPPYNTLWPLWSPALSPVNPTTGLPTPIVSNLAPSTVLPVQPGLTWDPSTPYPWLLYNTPVGMAYYDPLFGINLWPPSYLTLGPISLPPNYVDLPPTSSLWVNTFVPFANSLYLKLLPQFNLPTTPSSVPFTPPLPTAAAPLVPTVAAPPLPPLPVPAAPTTTIPLLTPTAII